MAKGKISPSMEKSTIWCIISGEIFSGFPYFCTIREVEGLGMRLQIELDWKVKAFNPYLQDKMYSLTLGHGTHIHKVQFFLIEMSWKSLWNVGSINQIAKHLSLIQSHDQYSYSNQNKNKLQMRCPNKWHRQHLTIVC